MTSKNQNQLLHIVRNPARRQGRTRYNVIGRRIHGRAEDPPEDKTTARSALVGGGAQRTGSLLPLSAALPHRGRSSRLLLHPHQSRRKTLKPGIRRACRFAGGSHRKEAA